MKEEAITALRRPMIFAAMFAARYFTLLFLKKNFPLNLKCGTFLLCISLVGLMVFVFWVLYFRLDNVAAMGFMKIVYPEICVKNY